MNQWTEIVLLTSYYREIGCWPWDVCAGIVIAEGAGGLVTGSNAAFSAAAADGENFGDVTEDILTGRKYIVVRAIADTPVSVKCLSVRLFQGIHLSDGNQGETRREAQRRIIREFYETVEEIEPV